VADFIEHRPFIGSLALPILRRKKPGTYLSPKLAFDGSSRIIEIGVVQVVSFHEFVNFSDEKVRFAGVHKAVGFVALRAQKVPKGINQRNQFRTLYAAQISG
jgi:hypothetical protein